MFARNANVVLSLMLAVLVSNGELLLSPSLGPAQPHHLQEHRYRQSKRQLSFDSEMMDRWLLYGRDDHHNDFRAPISGTKRYQRFDYSGTRPPWRKRTYGRLDFSPGGPRASLFSRTFVKQHVLRGPRNHRTYDVPQIECPNAEDGMERFACPNPDRMGRYRCIDDHLLCDGFIDCPNAEDEDRQACMFYKTTKAHLDVIADAVLRWARGR